MTNKPNLPLNVLFVAVSANAKTGTIPVTYSPRNTCPASCPLMGSGCYGDGYHTARAWDRAPVDGLSWSGLCFRIASLPARQLWRHDVVEFARTHNLWAALKACALAEYDCYLNATELQVETNEEE